MGGSIRVRVVEGIPARRSRLHAAARGGADTGKAATSEAGGVYVESDIERPIKLALMDAADQVVLVVDSGKFHRAGLVRLYGLDRVSTLVTDAPPPAPVRHEQRRTSLEILVAGTPGKQPAL